MAATRSGDRVRRACRNCAKARTKCSGHETCLRCQTKTLVCTYTNKASQPHDSSATCQDDVQVHDAGSYETAASQTGGSPSVIQEERSSTRDMDLATTPAASDPQDAHEAGQTDSLMMHADDAFNWNDSINWLPVPDNVDFSVLFANNAHDSSANDWQTIPTTATQVQSHSMRSSPSDSSDNDSAPVGSVSSLYAAGRGGRRSLLMVSKSPQTLNDDNDDEDDQNLGFPERVASHARQQDGNTLAIGTYNTLLEHFHLLCIRPVTYGRSFSSAAFPSSDQISRLVGVYLRCFDPDFPLVHRSTWQDETTPWILILAAATIGSCYSLECDSLQTTAALSEFLRRSVRWHLETGPKCEPLPLAQASLLHALVQLGNTTGTSASAARYDFELALEFYETNVTLFPPEQIDMSQPWLKWQAWANQESHIRLKWLAWILQALSIWFGARQKYVSLPDQHWNLPCESALWEAVTLDDWTAGISKARPSGNLLSSMQALFVRHQVPARLSSFDEVLLTYVTLARTDDVAKSALQPLHAWSPGPGSNPSSEERDIDLPPQDPVWLPANPQFAAWRNSACDALDVLHWEANGNVAKAYGSEGPIILHLHLVRLLLLCPYRDFISLAVSLQKRPANARRDLPSASQLDESVLRWLTMDDHKGRLSLVHAGAIFWYLRRYARGHFYEPFSIYLASLTIWVYGAFLPQVRGNLLRIKQMNAAGKAQRQPESENERPRLSESSSEEDEDDLTPNNILLDRPCDDEIVQTFVRRGHTMQADMSGATDICLPSSQKFVLQEGIKILKRSQYRYVGQSLAHRAVLQRLLQLA